MPALFPKDSSYIQARARVNPYLAKIRKHPDMIEPFISTLPSATQLKDKIAKLASNYNKLAVELGSGSGGHLLKRASRFPDTFFVGFELRFKRIVRTAEESKSSRLIQSVFN